MTKNVPAGPRTHVALARAALERKYSIEWKFARAVRHELTDSRHFCARAGVAVRRMVEISRPRAQLREIVRLVPPYRMVQVSLEKPRRARSREYATCIAQWIAVSR